MISYKIQCNESGSNTGWIYFDNQEWNKLSYAKHQLINLREKGINVNYIFRIVKVESKVIKIIL